jgi:hypothetical protein
MLLLHFDASRRCFQMFTWSVAAFVTLLEASWLRTTTPAVNPG